MSHECIKDEMLISMQSMVVTGRDKDSELSEQK